MPTIDNLVLEIQSNSATAEQGLDSLAKALEGLRVATSNQRSLNAVAKGIRNIADASNSLSVTGVQSLNEMTNALRNIGALNGVKLSTSFATQIKAIGDATRSLAGTDWSALQGLSGKLASLGSIQKATNLNNVVNALKKMPEAIDGVNKVDDKKIAEFTAKVEELRIAIRPLADEMRAVSAGFSSLPKNIQKAIQANAKLTASNQKTSKSFDSLIRKIFSMGTSYYIIRRGFDIAMDAFKANNAYVESLNLAEITLGENAEAAKAYAEQVERLAGINQTDWLTNLGTLNQMFQGFGVGADAAAKMSQQLTQLAYDIQSAYNVSDLSEVMRRLQSGITGEVEGMRRYGVELSNASMQEFLLARGINVKVSALNMADKAMVRYSMIMERTSNIQGDLARTIATPANALRILSGQVAVAGRYFGQLVSIIAAKVIPYVQAMVQVIAAAAKALASLWGYVLPNISTGSNSITGKLDDVADGVGGVGSAAKETADEVKGMLAAFDEINVIQQQKSDVGGAGGGGGGGGSALEDLDWLSDYEYDFLNGISSKVDEIAEKIKRFLPVVTTVGAALAAWKIADAVSKFFGSKNPMWGLFAATQVINISLVWDAVGDMIKNGLTPKNVIEWLSGALVGTVGGWALTKDWVRGLQLGFGVSLVTTGITLSISAISEKEEWKAQLMAAISAIAFTFGFWSITGSLGAGIIIATVAGITVELLRISWKKKSEAKEKFKSLFGEIELTQEEANQIALEVVGKDFFVDLKYKISEFESVETMRENVKSKLKEIEDTPFDDIDVGLKLVPEDKAAYTLTVDTFASDVQAYIDGNQKETLASLKVDPEKLSDYSLTVDTFAKDVTDYITQNSKAVGIGLELAGMTNDVQASLSQSNIEYVQTLGKKAQELFAQAFDANGGLVDIDAYKEASEIVKKLQEIGALVAKAQSASRLDTIALSYSGVELTAEGAYTVSQAIAEYLKQEQEMANKIFQDTATGYLLEIEMAEANLASDPNNKELEVLLEKAKADYQAYIDSNPIDLYMQEPRLRASNWAMNTWGGAFSQLISDSIGLDKEGNYVSKEVSRAVSSLLSAGLENMDANQFKAATGTFLNDVMETIEIGFGDIPMDKDMENFLSAYIEMGAYAAKQAVSDLMIGKEVGEEVVSNVNQYMMAAATAGDMDAIWYMVGKQLAESPEYVQLLATTSGLGETLNDSIKSGILANIDKSDPAYAEIANKLQTALDNSKVEVEPEIEPVQGSSYQTTLNNYQTETTTWATNTSALTQVTVMSPDLTHFNAGLMQAQSNALSTKRWIDSVFGSRLSTPSISFATNSSVMPVKQYASGGFPQDGQLFIANEAGPELVGQMGNKNAVANSAQIVQGVSSGVARANTSLEQKVDRLTRVVEAILSKEFTAEVRPSAALGKTVKRSMEMQAKVGG